jgi:polysaccharide biosynthesis transport protein
LILKKGPDVMPMQSGDPRQPYLDDYVGIQQVLIRSPGVLRYMVTKPDDSEKDTRPNSYNARLNIYNQFQTLSFSKNESQAIDQIMASLFVIRGADKEKEGGTGGPSQGGLNVLTLVFRGTNVEDCHQVVRLIIEAYKLYLEDTYKDVNQETIRQLVVARDKHEKDVGDAKKKFIEFVKKNPKVALNRSATKEGGMGVSDHFVVLQRRLDELNTKKMEIQNHLESIARARANPAVNRSVIVRMIKKFDTSTPDAVAKAHGPELNLEANLMSFLLQENELASKFGNDYAPLKSVRQQIDFVKKEIAKRDEMWTNGSGTEDMIAVHVQLMQQELEDLGVKEKNLSSLIDLNAKGASDALSSQAELSMLDDEIKRTGAFSQAIAEQLQKLKIITDSGGFQAEQLGPPTMAIQVEPRFALTFSLAAVAGLMIGFGLAYLMDLTDRSFRSEADISRTLRMPVVGHVPILSARATADPNSKLSVHLCTYHRPKSKDAEAFRQIRTALYFNTRNTNCRKLQITSAVSGDGKSTMAANLAISIAQSGKRVLLVDCDLRRPTIHTFFGITNEAGFSTVLTEQAEPADVTHVDVLPGLSVISAGPSLPNPAEILTSMRFQDCANLLAEKYDFVLFDTPPLLPVTDPAVIAPRMDGVFLVVRLGKRERNIAERSAEILRTLEAKVIGVVVNAGRDGLGYGAYGRYYYGRYSYYYGSGGYRYGNPYSYGNDAYYTEDDSPEGPTPPAPTSNGHKLVANGAAPLENGTNGAPTDQSGSIKRAFRWFLGD